ncbi:MAG TPA: lipocalin-like domain-containing protein, partial [Micromonospora sp.]
MTAYLADGPGAFDALGMKHRDIQPWEDGIRTDPHAHSFEWWYFDAHLADGSALVITFFTKQMLSPYLPLQPVVTLNLDRPDGTHVQRELHFSPEEFSASTERCDVRIGPNVFTGDLHTYRIHVEDEEITVDVTLTGKVPPWRPATGHLYFDDGTADNRHLFAWLPAVPDGTVEATLTHQGSTETIQGVGYHDHNWGDVPMNQIVHHWWWARARVGPYTVITCHITAEAAYGGDPVPVLMIARDGQVI